MSSTGRIAFVAEVTAATAVGFGIFGAGHDRVVGVDDERTRTRRHGGDGSESVRRPQNGCVEIDKTTGRGSNDSGHLAHDMLTVIARTD
jgi:hypothetical protein